MKALKYGFAATILAILTACGGGGSSSNDSSAADQAAAANAAAEAAKKQAIDKAYADAQTYVSQQMRDPSTVQFRNLTNYRYDSDTTVCGDFNAKNGFGAYVGYKSFYYRPSQTSPFNFVYQTNSTGSMAWLIDQETDKLIAAVCSSASKAEADAAQINYIKSILP